MNNPWPIMLALAILPTLAKADAPELAPRSLFPFVIPQEGFTAGTAVDMSYLNAKPAGGNGYIVVKNAHFVESKTGKRIRFLGTNFAFMADFPSRADADNVARRLAGLGINIVRIHHEDANQNPIWAKNAPGHTTFDASAIDKLDYLIAQLKKNGIYVDLNLHVIRQFTEADGFPASVNEIGHYDKRIDYLDRRMIDLQKMFAHDYLTRVNPYTGLSYTNDPAVAIIEINNENTLAGLPSESPMDYFDKLPEPFRKEVVMAWNDYLFRKYHTTDALRKSWFGVLTDASMEPDDLLNSSLAWSVEDPARDVKLKMIGVGTASTMPDVVVANPTVTDPAWHKQLNVIGLDLKESGLYRLTLRARSDKMRKVQVSIGLDHDNWHNIGLDRVLDVAPDWRTFSFIFQAADTVPHHARISFILGADAGLLSLTDMRLSRASADRLIDKAQSLEAHNLDLPDCATRQERADWRMFLVDSECRYANEMRGYLRKDLRVHANIVDTQISYGGFSGFKREAESDIADNHAYWQHPTFIPTGCKYLGACPRTLIKARESVRCVMMCSYERTHP
ncbi:MAG: beta-galactosidase [Capsulimonadaceae bacterium]|nr:beta-galactosidase [Capsulimonadaceae bacterium]